MERQQFDLTAVTPGSTLEAPVSLAVDRKDLNAGNSTDNTIGCKFDVSLTVRHGFNDSIINFTA